MKFSSAALVFVVVVGGCSNQSASSAVATPTASPSVVEIQNYEDQEGNLAPGRYVLHYSSIGGAAAFPTLAIAFTVPAGWQKVVVDGLVWNDNGVRLGFAVADNLYADPCDPAKGLMDPPVGPSVDDLAQAIATVPGWRVDSHDGEDVFFGYGGTRMELTGPESVTQCGTDEESRLLHIAGSPGYLPAITDRERHELLILNVAGTRLVVDGVTTTDATPEAIAQLQQVMSSIEIEG